MAQLGQSSMAALAPSGGALAPRITPVAAVRAGAPVQRRRQWRIVARFGVKLHGEMLYL
jgi:hypothetical protein